MTNIRKKIPLWQIEPIPYADITGKPTTWAELGLSGSFPFVSTEEQTLTETQQTQVKTNLGITDAFSLTLGTANGLSLAGEELSLALATTGASGAMASTDKLKLVGGTIVQGDGLTLTGTLTERLLSAGNLTLAVNSTVLRVSGDQVVTGLKEVRRFGANDGSTEGVVESWGIDSGSLHKLQLINTQNVQDPSGEVQWYFKYTSNTGAGAAKSRGMIGFARGAITILGGKYIPDTYYNTIVTAEGANAGVPDYRYPMQQFAYGITQFESGTIIGTDEIRVSKITADNKVYIEGGFMTVAPAGTTEASVRVGSYALGADTTSDIRWRVKVGDKTIDLLGVEVV